MAKNTKRTFCEKHNPQTGENRKPIQNIYHTETISQQQQQQATSNKQASKPRSFPNSQPVHQPFDKGPHGQKKTR